MDAIRRYWSSLERFSHGFYVNDLETRAHARADPGDYRSNLTRLVDVKNRYDPTNLFRLNANVKPTGQ
jgi:FAD/FMN-containing dehydrogenase